MPVLMFINIKGGVAKTTNAVAVSQFLAEAGNRVLLIDADHQCAAGELLVGETCLLHCERRGLTLHDLMGAIIKEEFNEQALAEYVLRVPSDIVPVDRFQLSVVPSSLRIDEFQKNYHQARHEFHSNRDFRKSLTRHLRRFRSWLQENFDYTIVDCPPSLPTHVQMLVKIADAYVVPTIPDKLSVRGAGYLVDRLRRTRLKIHGLGTLLTLYRAQNAIQREIICRAKLRKDQFASLPRAFNTIIPNATAIARAMEHSNANASLSTRFDAPFAKLYRNLVREIDERCRELAGADRQRQALCTTR